MRSARRKHPPPPLFYSHTVYPEIKGIDVGKAARSAIEICENACFVQCIKCIPPPPFFSRYICTVGFLRRCRVEEALDAPGRYTYF